MPISFRFRLIPFIACLLLVSLGVALAQWQTRRAEQKENMAAQYAGRMGLPALVLTTNVAATDLQAFRKIKVSGQFVSGWSLYLDNRPLQGKAGLYVLMPFKLSGSNKHVLVARGWQARDPRDRRHVPTLPVPTGEIILEGILRDKLDRVMQLGQPEAIKPGAMLQNLDIESLAQQTSWDFYPFVLEQTSATADGLSREWPLPSAGSEKHRAYAFQWYALAFMAFLFFIITGFRRGNRQ